MGLASFVDETVRRLQETPVDLGLLPVTGVKGSLFSGAAGVAFFLYEAARLRGDAELLGAARRWCNAARGWAETASKEDWRGLHRGFFIGTSGIAYVDALVSAREENPASVLTAVARFEQASSTFDDLLRGFRATEVVGGHGGAICAARDLEARLPNGAAYDEVRAILSRIRTRSIEALTLARKEPIPIDTQERRGFAHGIAGELWALATVAGAAQVVARLRELEALAESDEDGLVYWLPGPGASINWTLGTWCNGMAGQALLWTEIARQCPSRKTKALSKKVTDSLYVLRSGNSTVCCGLAGQAMALQRYAEVSGDGRFSKRAYARLERAVALAPSDSGHSLSFWQGSLGVALVAMKRLAGERAFPCLEPLPPAVMEDEANFGTSRAPKDFPRR